MGLRSFAARVAERWCTVLLPCLGIPLPVGSATEGGYLCQAVSLTGMWALCRRARSCSGWTAASAPPAATPGASSAASQARPAAGQKAMQVSLLLISSVAAALVRPFEAAFQSLSAWSL